MRTRRDRITPWDVHYVYNISTARRQLFLTYNIIYI